MPVLSLLDIAQIQNFIFRSNRLKDVVGASQVVEELTSSATIAQCGGSDLLMQGGGNALLRFHDIAAAQAFAARYSRFVFDCVPDLQVAITHQIYENNGLARGLQVLQRKSEANKWSMLPHSPLAGISVTAGCAQTGLPAAAALRAAAKEPLSPGLSYSRKRFQAVSPRWSDLLSSLAPECNYQFPYMNDSLGRSHGDTSQIGVVHVDGNSVGHRIAEWLQSKVDKNAPDAEVEAEYKKWSGQIQQTGQTAIKAAVKAIINSIRENPETKEMEVRGLIEKLNFPLVKERDGTINLPLRPILHGGDDLTFICDGRLALSLAEIVLASFKDCDVAPLAGGPLGACAGVAIVHAHAPFSQAYDLAESLCAMAKARLRAANKTGDYALDWHVGLVRGGNISRLREDQSDAATGKPYILGHPDERLTWLWLDHAVLGEDASSLRGTMWAKRRNKVKELGDICMDAPDELDARLEKWKVVEPSLRLPEGLKDGLILDALELFDLHQPLRNGLSEETVHGSA